MGRKKASHPKRYRDEDTLRRLYVEEGLSSREVAERLDCSPPTVVNWLKKFGIPLEPSKRDRPVFYGTSTQGYEYWQTDVGGRERETVRVHRLAAVAWFGFEAVAGNVVHHRNGLTYDNRELNLEPMDRGTHQTLHNEKRS